MTTLSVPSGTQLSLADVYIGIEGIGEVYYDCAQLEKGVSAGHFSLIENGDFTYGSDGYVLSNTGALDEEKDLSLHQYTEHTIYRKGVISGTAVNMRSGPGTSYTAVASLKKGNYITAIGEGLDANGVTWYYTYYISGDRIYSGYMILLHILKVL